MAQLLTLLRLSLSVSLLDVDNALYMTSVIDPLPPKKQKKAIRWGAANRVSSPPRNGDHIRFHRQWNGVAF